MAQTTWGSRGVRYDETCERCHRVGEVDNETGICRRCGPTPRKDGRLENKGCRNVDEPVR